VTNVRLLKRRWPHLDRADFRRASAMEFSRLTSRAPPRADGERAARLSKIEQAAFLCTSIRSIWARWYGVGRSTSLFGRPQECASQRTSRGPVAGRGDDERLGPDAVNLLPQRSQVSARRRRHRRRAKCWRRRRAVGRGRGVGIPAADVGRVFERFYKVKGARPGQGGTAWDGDRSPHRREHGGPGVGDSERGGLHLSVAIRPAGTDSRDSAASTRAFLWYPLPIAFPRSHSETGTRRRAEVGAPSPRRRDMRLGATLVP